MPRQSAQPLDGSEVDYDDLVIHRAWRVYEQGKQAEVRYFMYQLSQRDVGTEVYQGFYKAVRFLRVTRVPRYLRQINGGTGAIYGQQRKLLAGLREQQVLFVNLIAKSPKLPLVFAYGVQAIGSTIEEAQAECDRSFAVLQYLIDGVYQQLNYQPIRAEEAELLVRYQSQWRNIAVARGRPKPIGADGGVDSYLDGNRTDVESTQNMLDTFIRGMGDKSFMVSLVTVPVSPYELSGVWRNLARKLSDVRSEQSGSRAVSAGFALPLAMSAGHTDTVGASHGATHSTGTGTADSLSHSDTVGLSHSVADTQGVTQSQGVSASQSTSLAHTEGSNLGLTIGSSASQGVSQSHGTSASLSEGIGLSQGVSASQSISESASQGQSWSSSLSNSINAGVSGSTSVANNFSNSLSQGFTLVDTNSDGVADSISMGNSQTTGNGGSVSIPGLGGTGINMGQGSTQGAGSTTSLGSSNSLATSLTGGSSQGVSLGQTMGSNLGQSVGVTDSMGGNSTYGVAASNTVGQSLTQSQNLSRGMGINDSVGVNANVGQNVGQNAGVATANTASVGSTVGQNASSSVSASNTVTNGSSVASSDGVSQALMANQTYSNAYVSALSKAAANTNSIGVVPNLGVMLSRNTYDEGKRVIGDLIEAQMNRYLEGIESGAYFYQMFLVCEDEQTLRGASGLLKSSFWGPGDSGKLPQPFHVTDRFDESERERLLQHAAAFTSYRKREYSMELVEPYAYSTYLTPGEGASMTQPPTAESLGLLAVHDSMPVFAMPYDRGDKDIYLGHVINGERGIVSNQPYGLDLDELTHTLVAGTTGSGKTTLLRRMVLEAVQSSREVVDIDLAGGRADRREVPAGALILDWARSFRGLAALVPQDRFNFFCITKPELGRFRFNPLALPDEGMNAVEWANALADLFMVAFGLGEFARSIFYEKIAELYAANRLEPYVLRPEVRDEDGVVVRAAIELPAVDPALLPAGAIAYDPAGGQVANVYSCAALSRLVSLEHVAILVAAAIEYQATREGKAMGGMNMQDRLQTVWRRIMVFAPGGALADLFAADERLDRPQALRVPDLINPEKGLVTVIEADGLDLANRKFVLGAVLQAVFRYGLHHGEGVFGQGGKGPGTFIVLEEAHELFGSQGDGEDREAAATRVAIYEAMFRRARFLDLKLVAAVQNPADVPNAILGNVGCVVSHQIVTEADKNVMGSLFNWISGIGQQYRELRYLGEMAVGHCIIRLKAHDNFLQAAPVHLAVDAPDFPRVDDAYLARRAR